MTIGTMTKVHLDASADDPKLARAELATNADEYNLTATHLNSSVITATPLTVGDGLESSGGTLRLKNGNSIIRVSTAPEINQPTRSIVAGDTIIATDRGKLLLCNGTFTLATTAAATLADGFKCAVRNVGAGVITINPNASELIDGATTITLAAGESCEIGCNGSAFFTVGRLSIASIATAQYVAKFWANIYMVGTVTLDDSYNVSGVVDNGTGDVTVTIDTDMGNANYALGLGCHDDTGSQVIVNIISLAVGSCRLITNFTGGTNVDVDPVTVICCGD